VDSGWPDEILVCVPSAVGLGVGETALEVSMLVVEGTGGSAIEETGML
jgi:hypothetical protein